MKQRILSDTGPVVALLSEADANHHRCFDKFDELDQPIFTCWPVVVEAAWLLRRQPDLITRLLSLFASGALQLLPLDRSDLPPISAILTKYADLRLQLANAALLHLAARESIDTIFTLDRRDFGVVRLANRKRPRLIP